jgi:hypothetical protein
MVQRNASATTGSAVEGAGAGTAARGGANGGGSGGASVGADAPYFLVHRPAVELSEAFSGMNARIVKVQCEPGQQPGIAYVPLSVCVYVWNGAV